MTKPMTLPLAMLGLPPGHPVTAHEFTVEVPEARLETEFVAYGEATAEVFVNDRHVWSHASETTRVRKRGPLVKEGDRIEVRVQDASRVPNFCSLDVYILPEAASLVSPTVEAQLRSEWELAWGQSDRSVDGYNRLRSKATRYIQALEARLATKA